MIEHSYEYNQQNTGGSNSAELRADLMIARQRIAELEAERQRLRDALPPPDRLRILADWFDCNHWSPDTEVQDDLRGWAEAIEQALEKVAS